MPLGDGIEPDQPGQILIMVVLAQQLMVGPQLIERLRLQVYPVTRKQLAQRRLGRFDGRRASLGLAMAESALTSSGLTLLTRSLALPSGSCSASALAAWAGSGSFAGIPPLHFASSGLLVSYPNRVADNSSKVSMCWR